MNMIISKHPRPGHRATGPNDPERLDAAVRQIQALNPTTRLYPSDFVHEIAKRFIAARDGADLERWLAYREIVVDAPAPVLAFLKPSAVARLAGSRARQNRIALENHRTLDAQGRLLAEWEDFLAIPELGVSLAALRDQAGDARKALGMATSDHYMRRRMVAEAPRQTEGLAMHFQLVGGRRGEMHCSRWARDYLLERERETARWAETRQVKPGAGRASTSASTSGTGKAGGRRSSSS